MSATKRAIAGAVTLFESFREARPQKIGSVRLKVPKAVAVMGYVEGIDYRTTHQGKLTLYHHDFAPGSRPLLAVASDGQQLLLLGGRYVFTERGIVDKDARGRQITNPVHGKRINPRAITCPFKEGSRKAAWFLEYLAKPVSAREFIARSEDTPVVRQSAALRARLVAAREAVAAVYT